MSTRRQDPPHCLRLYSQLSSGHLMREWREEETKTAGIREPQLAGRNKDSVCMYTYDVCTMYVCAV